MNLLNPIEDIRLALYEIKAMKEMMIQKYGANIPPEMKKILIEECHIIRQRYKPRPSPLDSPSDGSLIA